MFKSLKINTALFICSAFILRLLFINIGILCSFNTHQSPAKGEVVFKLKRQGAEVSTSKETAEYSTAEICEEDSDETSSLKSNPFLFVHVFQSLFSDNLAGDLKKISPFNKPSFYSGSDRYLAIRVFRI